MNPSPPCCDRVKVAAYAVAILGALLIVALLSWAVAQKTRAPGIDQERVELRRKNLAEMRADDVQALATYGWVDQTKGIVRLPIERAMELSLALAQDPAAGRSNLLARLDKATAKPPEKPNPYE